MDFTLSEDDFFDEDNPIKRALYGRIVIDIKMIDGIWYIELDNDSIVEMRYYRKKVYGKVHPHGPQ